MNKWGFYERRLCCNTETGNKYPVVSNNAEVQQNMYEHRANSANAMQQQAETNTQSLEKQLTTRTQERDALQKENTALKNQLANQPPAQIQRAGNKAVANNVASESCWGKFWNGLFPDISDLSGYSPVGSSIGSDNSESALGGVKEGAFVAGQYGEETYGQTAGTILYRNSVGQIYRTQGGDPASNIPDQQKPAPSTAPANAPQYKPPAMPAPPAPPQNSVPPKYGEGGAAENVEPLATNEAMQKAEEQKTAQETLKLTTGLQNFLKEPKNQNWIDPTFKEEFRKQVATWKAPLEASFGQILKPDALQKTITPLSDTREISFTSDKITIPNEKAENHTTITKAGNEEFEMKYSITLGRSYFQDEAMFEALTKATSDTPLVKINKESDNITISGKGLLSDMDTLGEIETIMKGEQTEAQGKREAEKNIETQNWNFQDSANLRDTLVETDDWKGNLSKIQFGART